jgi:hypothetical protein
VRAWLDGDDRSLLGEGSMSLAQRRLAWLNSSIAEGRAHLVNGRTSLPRQQQCEVANRYGDCPSEDSEHARRENKSICSYWVWACFLPLDPRQRHPSELRQRSCNLCNGRGFQSYAVHPIFVCQVAPGVDNVSSHHPCTMATTPWLFAVDARTCRLDRRGLDFRGCSHLSFRSMRPRF